jgi:uridylate kinase
MKYNRIMLKLSGEALMGKSGFGQDFATIARIAADIREVASSKLQLCIVIGGGNLHRGKEAAKLGIERASADYMGMLATVMNALAVQSVLETLGLDTRVLSAIPMNSVCEPFIRRRAIRHMERSRVVICAAGTGNPFFTTDTAAALRAIELDCDALFKATQVDGVYSADPKTNPDAEFFPELTYKKVLENDLQVMDGSAIALARENALPIVVFSIIEKGGFAKVINGEGKHTIIKYSAKTGVIT